MIFVGLKNSQKVWKVAELSNRKYLIVGAEYILNALSKFWRTGLIHSKLFSKLLVSYKDFTYKLKCGIKIVLSSYICKFNLLFWSFEGAFQTNTIIIYKLQINLQDLIFNSQEKFCIVWFIVAYLFALFSIESFAWMQHFSEVENNTHHIVHKCIYNFKN
jgi:hypothetical protein